MQQDSSGWETVVAAAALLTAEHTLLVGIAVAGPERKVRIVYRNFEGCVVRCHVGTESKPVPSPAMKADE